MTMNTWKCLVLACAVLGAALAEAGGLSTNDATAWIQRDIDAAFRAGGGTVTVGAGEWRVKGIRLRSNVTLHLKSGAVLKASRDMEDFDVLGRDTVEALAEQDRHPALPVCDPCRRWNRAIVFIYRARNVRIVGEPGAVIDGMNSYDPRGEEHFRGAHGIAAWRSDHVALKGFEIRRTGNWATRYFDCRDVSFENLTITGGHDGVHVRRCDRVSVRNCTIACGDDCVAGFDNQDVTVEGCTFNTSCSVFRFGGRHVRIRDCRARGPGIWPHRLSLPEEDKRAGLDGLDKGRHNTLSFFTYFADLSHGPLRCTQGDIVVENCTIENVQRFLHYNLSGNERWQKAAPLTDIAFRNCTATNVGMSLCAYGAQAAPLELTLEDCAFSFAPAASEFVRGAWVKDLAVRRCKVSGVQGSLLRSWGGETALTAESVDGVPATTVKAETPFHTNGI